MAKTGKRGLDRLIARTYDAALDEGAWDQVIAELLRQTGSIAGGVLRHSPRTQQSRPYFLRGITPAFRDTYREHYRQRIPWIGNPAFYRPGQVRTDRTINRYFNDGNAFRSTEYYNDWMRPQGFGHIMRSVLRDDADGCVSLFMFREADRGAYGGGDTDLFHRLMPHLIRAGEIRRRFERAELRSARADHAADSLSLGVVHLDHLGRLQQANRFAERLLQRADGLTCRAGRLMATASGERASFDTAVRRALGSAGGISEKFSLTRRRGDPLAVTLIPVTRESAVFGDSAASAILLIADPQAQAAVSPEMLIAVHGLTPSEARLAVLLADGGGLRQAAARRPVTAAAVAFWALTSAVLFVGDRFGIYMMKYAAEIAAFEDLRDDPAVCGVALVGIPWTSSAGYTYLHRDIPLYAARHDEDLTPRADAFNAVLAPARLDVESAGYQRRACHGRGKVCVSMRAGTCTPRPAEFINEVLIRHGH